MDVKGTQDTKDFYDNVGWRTDEAGVSVDEELFGTKEDGPLRQRMTDRKWQRIREHIRTDTPPDVLEVGCGGSPSIEMLKDCGTYCGADFSSTGLALAAKNLENHPANARFVEADAVDLPFEDASFDTVYSAHMIYHIVDKASQSAALQEMVRVLKPGGTLVLITANPRPLLFPARMLIRIVADTPVLSQLARKIKGSSPIPYRPAKISAYKREFARCQSTRVINGGIPSTAFNQSVSELRWPTKALWLLFDALDNRFPTLSAYLGNYAIILVRK